LTPLQIPAFRRLWASTLASSGAQGMERTATAWLALQAGDGAFDIGLVFAARMLPSLLLGLVAGTIADRSDRPRQLLAVAAASLLLMAVFGWIVGGGQIALWQVIAFAFAIGTLTVFDMPARQALVLDTVPRADAPRALALNALAARFAAAGGAILVGFLISRTGVGNSYYAIAIAYALTGAFVATIGVPQHRNTLVTPPPFKRAFGEAARLIVDLPGIRVLFIAGLVCEIFAFSYLSALPLFADNVLGAGAEGLGLLNAAVSIGGAVAVILLSVLPSEMPRQPVLGMIFLLYGIAIVIFAATRNLFLSAAILVAIGFCAAAFDVLQQTLIQLAVPDEQRGRAVGVWVLGIGSAPIGHLEMGAMAAWLGVPAALLLNGSLTILSALLLLLLVPAYRWKAWAELVSNRNEY
jgi:MFS family permease